MTYICMMHMISYIYIYICIYIYIYIYIYALYTYICVETIHDKYQVRSFLSNKPLV